MHDWADRLRQAMVWKEWTAADLAREAEIDAASLYKYLQGRVAQPRGDVIQRIAKAMGVNELWLKDGAGPHYARVPVVGYVGAGETFIPYDDLVAAASLDEIEFDIDSGDPIAVQVRGTSMEPVYRPGDHLVCSRRHNLERDDFVGRDCVVLTARGEGYVKRVVAGTRPGRYTLLSYAALPIEDIELRWAAPIVWVRRRQ